ncbi:MAG: hypothetical protein QOJ29_706 [Thermoleophilaceae bacterium]|jgi:hypothetical protein|nr:hypothetical protein [Thermoleophilaceae bacterium]
MDDELRHDYMRRVALTKAPQRDVGEEDIYIVGQEQPVETIRHGTFCLLDNEREEALRKARAVWEM